MLRYSIIIFSALLMVSSMAYAQGSVVKVSRSQQYLVISRAPSFPWRKGARLCVFNQERALGCGAILKLSKKAAVLKLDKASPFVAKGDKVVVGEQPTPKVARLSRRKKNSPPPLSREPRQPATLLTDSYAEPKAPIDGWNLSGGISAGFTFFFPMLHLQRRLGSYYAIGIQPSYFRSSAEGASVGAIGGLLTLNYYGNEYFRGMWLQLGAGLQRFDVENFGANETGTSPTVIGTFGWRGYWDLGLNVGVALGAQYVVDPEFATTEIQATGIQPVFVLDVGFNF